MNDLDKENYICAMMEQHCNVALKCVTHCRIKYLAYMVRYLRARILLVNKKMKTESEILDICD